MRTALENLLFGLVFLFSVNAFSGLPDLYKALEYIDSSNKINMNSSQEDVEQTLRMLLRHNDLERIIVQKNPDGSISASQKGERIAQAILGRSVPNPYLIVESVKNGIQLLLDPVRRDQYDKVRVASDEKVSFEIRLQAIDSLPSIDLQLKMGLSLSNEDAKRGQKLTTEAEQGLVDLIKTDHDDILRAAAIKALKNSSGYNEKAKNELLSIVKNQGLVSPRLRAASAEVLWVFNLNSTDIATLTSIARNPQEQAEFRARVFHTIEIKSPQPIAHNLYREITGEDIGDIYIDTSPSPFPTTARSEPPRTMYLAKAMGYGGQPGTTYTLGRDNDLTRERGRRLKSMHVQRFKEALLKVRGNTTGRCHRRWTVR